MTYVEKMTMKIMGEMAYNYGNPQEPAKTIRQIIADTKRADKKAIREKWDQYEKLDTDITPGVELYCKVIDKATPCST